MRRPKGAYLFLFIPEKRRFIICLANHCNLVLTLTQVHQSACCRWQPHIAYIKYRHVIYCHKMSVAHLTQIQKQRIFSLTWHSKTTCIHSLILGYSLSTMGSGNFSQLAFGRIIAMLKGQLYLIVSRIKVCQSVLVPKEAIALIRINKG